MKIYLAALYSRRLELAAYRKQIEALGHTVTSRWLNGEHVLPMGALMQDEESVEELRRFAREDVSDVLDADLVISFTETGPTPRGGRHVEFGLAFAVGKRLWVVPGRENIFHWLPSVEAMTWEEALDRLRCPVGQPEHLSD